MRFSRLLVLSIYAFSLIGQISILIHSHDHGHEGLFEIEHGQIHLILRHDEMHHSHRSDEIPIYGSFITKYSPEDHEIHLSSDFYTGRNTEHLEIDVQEEFTTTNDVVSHSLNHFQHVFFTGSPPLICIKTTHLLI